MVTGSGEVEFCHVCRRLRPVGEFPRGNRSTCRACKTARERARVSSDPERHRVARRQRHARQQLRTRVGVEAAGAPTMVASLQAGHCERLERLHTMADGIAVARRAWAPAGRVINTWPVDDVLEWLRSRGA